jgi:hypothetical protein
MAHARLYAVALLDTLAAQAVAVVENVEKSFVLQFRTFVFDKLSDVFIAQRAAGRS